MQVTYDVRIAALTVRADAKWVDNLLSHHVLPGVERARQGVERRVGRDGLLAMELVRLLSREGGLTVGRAATLVNRAAQLRNAGDFVIELATGIELRIDARAIEARLLGQLADAIEAAPRVARGRPRLPQKKTPDA